MATKRHPLTNDIAARMVAWLNEQTHANPDITEPHDLAITDFITRTVWSNAYHVVIEMMLRDDEYMFHIHAHVSYNEMTETVDLCGITFTDDECDVPQTVYVATVA